MRIELKKSFLRAFKKLTLQEQDDTSEVLGRLIEALKLQLVPKGLGLKSLIVKSRIWEVRVNRSVRLIFRYEGDLLEFAFVGTHDDLRKYLKSLQ
ncbi:MAG: hypothetical protein V2A78_10500 [bacterium]